MKKYKTKLILSTIILSLTIGNSIFAKENIVLDKQLGILNLSKDNLKEITTRDLENDNEFKTFFIDKGYNQKIIIDKNNEIIKLNQISNLDKNNVNRSYLTPYSNIEKTLYNLIDSNIIDSSKYKLYTKNLLLDDVWEFIFVPNLEVINTYNSIKVGIDASTSSVLYMNKSKDYIVKDNYLDNIISKETAINIASKIFNTNKNLETELKVFDITPDKEKSEKIYVISYIVKNENGNRIVIDAYNSNIVYKDKTENRRDGRAFYFIDSEKDESDHSRFRQARAYFLDKIMNHLGYNSTQKKLARSSSSRNEMLNFLNGYYSYGFTFSGHGSPNSIGSEDQTFRIYPNDISGIWKFVFLDACSTAKNTNWASAFNIYEGNGNGRCFIGWSRNLYPNQSYKFLKVYERKIRTQPNTSVVENILDAFNELTDDTYYVKFYGDRRTTGR